MNLTPKAANLVAGFLTLLGCLSMVGYLVGSRAMRGIGAASVASPFPKVFSDVDGLETFASEFVLHWRDGSGAHAWPITAELYSKLEGAYNRRNVYGAALSYGPRMPEPLWSAVFCYGFSENGPLRREFGLPLDATDIAVEVKTRTRGRDGRWWLQPECLSVSAKGCTS